MTSKAVVISNAEQLNVFRRQAPEIREYSVYCDNSAFYTCLEAEKISFVKLDEFLIQSHWQQVNAWGCEKAAGWISVWKNFKNAPFNLAEVIYLRFAYILIQALKNYLLAGYVFMKSNPSEILIFKSRYTRSYPEFSGNAFLNIFLEDLAKKSSVKTTKLEVSGQESLEPLFFDARSKFLRRAAMIAKTLLKKMVVLVSRHPKEVDILVHGSRRHLEPLVLDLHKKGLKIAIYDPDFNSEHFRLARREGISYLTAESFSNVRLHADSHLDAEAVSLAVSDAMKEAEREGYFVYEGHDFSGFIRREIVGSMDKYFQSLVSQHELFGRITQSMVFDAVLVDEDFAQQRTYFVTYMRNFGKKSFCVSHANLAVDFQVPESSRVFAKSATIVQSEFEKEMYAARGWDPKNFLIAGSPRFDSLVARCAQRVKNGSAQRPFRLLCVVSGIYPHTPDSLGFLGSHIYCIGNFQKQFFDAVTQAVRDLPVEFILKPHDAEDEPIWRKLVQESGVGSKGSVAPSSSDFVSLMLECDAVVISYWSTTMIEAAIAKKPVFFMEIPRRESPVLEKWSGQGFCHLVQDAEGLKNAILSRITPTHDRGEKACYYLGQLDGKNTQRVTEAVISQLKGAP